ncbi:RNA polymerase sigma factor [Roseimaritima sediminicola]|uniref:RNA polymerase sigma factor n=1 Tax=Roseimaritima sediminicola TaxID=2662066 RepID=UPI00129838F8|nr:RNA polymerase sigma factor [Roseimaritima sediminicola]
MRPRDELVNGNEPADALTDEAIVRKVRGGDLASFELLMRRYNQRLYRVARSILGNDAEAEDAVQEAYVRAYEHLAQFRGEAAFSTWLTKITVYEALGRRKIRQRFRSLQIDPSETRTMQNNENTGDPFEQASRRELQNLLVRSVDALPEGLRVVFTLRVIDGLGTRETAQCLRLSEANVKTRLYRARTLLQQRIDRQIGVEVRLLHQFDGARCDRLVRRVLRRIHRR